MQKDIYCPSASSELDGITCLVSLADDHEMPILRSAVAELRRANFAMQSLVEPIGIEPTTSTMPLWRSSN